MVGKGNLAIFESNDISETRTGVKGGDWAVLPSLVSSMEQYYVKTRYPNQHHPSVAPADVYSHYTKRDEIENAVSNTKKLIKLIQRLF